VALAGGYRLESVRSRPTSYVPALGFDRLTALYDPVVRLTTRERTFKRRLLDQAALGPGERVLDLGCGTGTFAVWAKQRAPDTEVVGLDGDPEVLGRARAKASAAGVEVDFRQGLADRLPDPDGSFDKVTSSLLFHHLAREVKEAAAREVARVLRPGGALHVADFGPTRDPLARAAFGVVQVFDGFGPTSDNVAGRLPDILRSGGLLNVQERSRLRVLAGSLSLWSAERA
jgi:ubiquinone/menaquinone biosynthesis C-methylase UbiE